MKQTIVILSGRRISSKKVEYETRRHNPPTWSNCRAPAFLEIASR